MGRLIPGVTSGLYSVARSPELSTPTKKVGYAITKGIRAVEISSDVPQEVTITEGEEIRAMAKKQGLTISLHGPLNAAMELPDRFDWRDADELMKRAVISACHLGAIYVVFHASLNIWLELLTYTGRRLTLTFADHRGRFFSTMLKESSRLRKWFVKTRWSRYLNDILTNKELREALARASIERGDRWIESEVKRRIAEELKKKGLTETPKTPKEEIMINEIINRVTKEVQAEAASQRSELEQKYVKEAIEKKLEKGERWDSEDLRGIGGTIEGYHIMFRYLFYTKDPQFTSMAKFYSKVLEKYGLDYSDDDWPDKATQKMEDENDLEFKEFFYSVCAAKYIEGHLIELKNWIDNELVKKEFKNNSELQEYAKNLKIAIESPDARDPSYPGRYMIWRPKQIYSLVKTTRQIMKNDFVWITPDFEHTAMQGADSVLEFEELMKIAPDFGEYVISVHSNSPNPLQPHNPLEYGDVRLYRCMYALKKTGLAKHRDVYLFFERGGGEDPFKMSVDVLRIIIKCLEKEIHPKDLPLDFFGITEKFSGNIVRQQQIIRDHAFDIIKDLLEMPEEDWSALSREAIKKGKKPEQWKRGEFR